MQTSKVLFILMALCWLAVETDGQVTRTWVGTTEEWHDPANWSPIGVPGGQDDVIHYNFGNPITLNDSPTTGIDSLRISDGGQLFTDGGVLTIHDFGDSGLAKIIGNGSELIAEPPTTASNSVSADSIELESGGALIMEGGRVRVDNHISVDLASRISGHGNIELLASDSEDPPTVMNVAGTIRSIGGSLGVFAESNSLVDFGAANLDAAFGNLFFNVSLAEPFQGTINVGQGQAVLFDQPFEFGTSATLNLFGGDANNPAVLNSPETEIRNRVNVNGSAALSGRTVLRGVTEVYVPNPDDQLRITGAEAIVQGNAFNPTNPEPSFEGDGRVVNETNNGMVLFNGPKFESTFVNDSPLTLTYFYFVLFDVGTAEFEDFVQTEEGLMRFDIGQDQDGDLLSDMYLIRGIAQLAGRLDVHLVDLNNLGLPELQAGDSIDVIASAAGIVGQFDEITFSHAPPAGTYWQTVYDATSVRITLTDVVPGDVNGDGEVNLLDVTPFVDAVVDGDFIPAADINQDGAVDLLDVQPFVALLIG